MRNKNIRLLFVVLVLSSVALACDLSFSTANFADAWMAADPEGVERTATYGQEDTLYAFVDLANAPSDTQVRAVWIAVDIEGEEPNMQLHDVSITSGDSVLVFDLTNDLPWPIGQYRVDFYMNEELETSLDFQVQ
ncbi:MAG: hypothetical protein ACRDFQ_09715 [Anaerolineales bacterium]